MAEVTTRARLRGWGEFLADAVLGSYSQVMFSRSRWVGLAFLAATFLEPARAVFGILAVLLSLVFARFFKFHPESIRGGLFGYNALLVGLGLAWVYQPGFAMAGLVVGGVLLVVLATATLNSALGASFNLPSLTLPFVFVFWSIHSFGSSFSGVEAQPLSFNPMLHGDFLPMPVAAYLRSLGILFFLPRVDAGALVLVGLLIFSRIGFMLSVVGFSLAWFFCIHVLAVPDGHLMTMMGFNLVLTAVALGGLWFVPSWSSFALALVSALVSAFVTLSADRLLQPFGLAVLILPFNLTVIPMLYAMRLRVRDQGPKAADLWKGTPEENLNFYQTRISRFGYLYHLRIGLPFLGRWSCTQGNDGEYTHQGHWRHGFDFEVPGSDGLVYQGAGRRAEDHHCFRLPVLACADGTVVRVVDHVPDNPIGEMNTRENWGNLVLIYHGVGVYSMVAHLARGSVKVREGAVVRRGEQLGLCGNSGRSPRPHIHFQLQATDRIGAPTIEAAFHEVVVPDNDDERLFATLVPSRDQLLRNLEPRQELQRVFAFPLEQSFLMTSPGEEPELIESEIDLFGNLTLRSPRRKGILFYESRHSAFIIYDYQGSPRSVLSLLMMAVPRIPMEDGRNLVWTDHLVSRHFYTWGWRVLRDFVSPFLGLGGHRMEYRVTREGSRLRIAGGSQIRMKDGSPQIQTLAVWDMSRGLQEVRVVNRTRRREWIRALEPDPGLTGEVDDNAFKS